MTMLDNSSRTKTDAVGLGNRRSIRLSYGRTLYNSMTSKHLSQQSTRETRGNQRSAMAQRSAHSVAYLFASCHNNRADQVRQHRTGPVHQMRGAHLMSDRSIAEIPEKTIARFWAKVHIGDGGCWQWTGAKSRQGYGNFRIARQTILATHVALHIAGIPRENGAFALHSCDNPSCVNPAHLRWGTNAENMADRSARGRHKWQHGPEHQANMLVKALKGEKHGTAKLTDNDVLTIRASKGLTHKALADAYGVCTASISHIMTRRTWRHI